MMIKLLSVEAFIELLLIDFKKTDTTQLKL